MPPEADTARAHATGGPSRCQGCMCVCTRAHAPVLASALTVWLVCRAPRVLEAGCGSGSNVFHLAAAMPSASIHAVDISPVAVEVKNGWPAAGMPRPTHAAPQLPARRRPNIVCLWACGHVCGCAPGCVRHVSQALQRHAEGVPPDVAARIDSAVWDMSCGAWRPCEARAPTRWPCASVRGDPRRPFGCPLKLCIWRACCGQVCPRRPRSRASTWPFACSCCLRCRPHCTCEPCGRWAPRWRRRASLPSETTVRAYASAVPACARMPRTPSVPEWVGQATCRWCHRHPARSTHLLIKRARSPPRRAHLSRPT
jgi:hypothetical protein